MSPLAPGYKEDKERNKVYMIRRRKEEKQEDMRQSNSGTLVVLKHNRTTSKYQNQSP